MKLKITVHGVAYEVDVEVLDLGEGFPVQGGHHLQRTKPVSNGNTAPTAPRPAAPVAAGTASNGNASGFVTSPIGGTILEIKCKAGDSATKGQVLLVVEAMKMKTSIAAPAAGTIKAVKVAVGDNVQEGQTLIEFE